jgi:hypothetical protein
MPLGCESTVADSEANQFHCLCDGGIESLLQDSGAKFEEGDRGEERGQDFKTVHGGKLQTERSR